MTTEPTWRNYLQLTKPRITQMVVLTTWVGYLVAGREARIEGSWALVLHTLIGTALLSSAASALNQWAERDLDRAMRRTAQRPLPAGRLQPEKARLFGWVLAVLGTAELAWFVNVLTAGLGAATLLLYLYAYTPMKTRSSLATLIGAVPGAVPPMMGTTAITGQLGSLGWVLFGILFLWQMPHFLAIAWLYRSDYERGGFPLLTIARAGEHGELAARRTARQMGLYAAALLPVSLLPSVLGYSGVLYLIGAFVLGLVFVVASLAFAFRPQAPTARRLLLTSVLYLPVVLLLMVVDGWVRFPLAS